MSRMRKSKGKQSTKKSVIIDFEEIANQVNSALDFSKVVIKDKQMKSIENYKAGVDKQWNWVKDFFMDFQERLQAAIDAGKVGGDEVKAFRDGNKKEEKQTEKSDKESEDGQTRVQKQLMAM